MNHEHEQSRTGSTSAEFAHFHDDTVEPGQSSRSAGLHKPEHAIRSGLLQREDAGSGSMEQDKWDHRLAGLRNASDLAQLRARWTALLPALASLGDDASERARATGQAAGDRLWQLARDRMQRTAADPNERVRDFDAHFDPLHQMSHDAGIAGGPGMAIAIEAFEQAGRGMSSINWDRPGPDGGHAHRVLITGFDPFASPGQPPAPRSWNPSGAAAMRLDGEELTETGQRVAIEGIVYPVSFEQFDQGIVERVVSGQADADAIITVSLDSDIGTDAPVHIEQYAVGMHNRMTISPHATRREVAHLEGEERIPLAGRGPEARPVTAAPGVTGIGEEEGDRADVFGDMYVRFCPGDVQRAISTIGAIDDEDATRYGPCVLHVTQPDVTAAIAGGSYIEGADSRDTHMRFTANGETFVAEIVSGPGGSFLSNEVAYRTQRQLAASDSSATSFHVHTPGQDADLNELVDTLRSIVRSVIRRRLLQRAVAGGGLDLSDDDAQAVAAHGVVGAGRPLPHLDCIQRAFGRHDVHHATAHVGGAAAVASKALGARAYATGDRIAFRAEPDLHLAAHEAAHVVQQAGGVQLAAGVGSDGDEHERHADAVADHVVAGRSAEELLDRYTGDHHGGAQGESRVQRSPDDEAHDRPQAGRRHGRPQSGRRLVITFIMGPNSDEMYRDAAGYWQQRGRADSVVRSARNLAAILDYLRATPPSNDQPWGEINIVVHANAAGGMGIGVDAVDSDGSTGYTDNAEIRDAMGPSGPIRALSNNIVDHATNVNVHGCDIGRSAPGTSTPPPILQTLSEAFGGIDDEAPTVYAPTHLQFYGHHGRQPYEALADEIVTLPLAAPSDAEIITALRARHGDAPPGGGTWDDVLGTAVRHTNRYPDWYTWTDYKFLPRRGTIGTLLPPTEAVEHRALIASFGLTPATWRHLTVVSWTTSLLGTGNERRDRHVIVYNYQVDDQQETRDLTVDNPVIPVRTMDIVSVSHPELVDQYEWTPAAVPRPHGQVGSTSSGVFHFTGTSTMIASILRDANGQPIHPSRTDAAYYGHYTPLTPAVAATPNPSPNPSSSPTPATNTPPTPAVAATPNPSPDPSSGPTPDTIQRKRHDATAQLEATETTSAVLEDSGGGQPLPEAVRCKAERVLGAELSAVRIHEGPQPQAVDALAYTRGRDIHFAPGQYDPESRRGKELLGHELAHVIQQAQSQVQPTTEAAGVGINESSALESQANELGAKIAASGAGPVAVDSPLGEGTKDTLDIGSVQATGPSHPIQCQPAGRDGAAQDDESVLDERRSRSAITFNTRRHLPAEAWTKIAEVAGVATAAIDDTIVQAIARWQRGKGLTANGNVDDITLQWMSCERGGEGLDELVRSNATVYMGANPSSRGHELRTLRSGGGEVAGATGRRAQHTAVVGRSPVDLTIADGLNTFVASFDRVPEATRTALRTFIELSPANSRDELAQFVRFFYEAEIGMGLIRRVVLSGHSSGVSIAGVGTTAARISFGHLHTLPDLFPRAVRQVEDLMLSACNTGHEDRLGQYHEIFPNLRSIWGYVGFSPRGNTPGSGANRHIAQWERATRGPIDHERVAARAAHTGRNVAIWTRDGAEATPHYETANPDARLDFATLRGLVDGAMHVADLATIGRPALELLYNRLQILTSNYRDELGSAHRDYVRMMQHVLELRHPHPTPAVARRNVSAAPITHGEAENPHRGEPPPEIREADDATAP